MNAIEPQELQNDDKNLNAETAIRVHNLSKIYKLYPDHKARMKEALHPMRKKYHKNFYALNKVSFEVKKGEVLGIIGKNGSGKSTLLKIIAEVLQPTSGYVQTNGKISAMLELGAGFNPEFTGLENLYFYGSIMGYSRNEMDAKREEIISFADIGEFINQPLKNYSSGMKSRLAFATAINIDPDILIVDEVLAVGDELFRRKCYAKIENFMAAKKTILFVSHSVETIKEICSRAIMLDQGELILDGIPKIVTAQYDRLLNALPGLVKIVRDEIKAIIQNTDFNIIDNCDVQSVKKQKIRKIVECDKVEKASLNLQQQSFYINGLNPKSRIVYKNFDVDIDDVHIRNFDGKRVNVLVTEECYIYSYKVKFNADIQNVAFGMKIKSEKGITLSGASSFKFGEEIKKASKEETYIIDWNFICHLMPGTYYTNLGISTKIDGKPIYIARIIDAIAFRVQKIPIPKFGCSGFMYLNQDVKIKKIK
jgi:lipopolysaccharide transport system ATP-binding protein